MSQVRVRRAQERVCKLWTNLQPVKMAYKRKHWQQYVCDEAMDLDPSLRSERRFEAKLTSHVINNAGCNQG